MKLDGYHTDYVNTTFNAIHKRMTK